MKNHRIRNFCFLMVVILFFGNFFLATDYVAQSLHGDDNPKFHKPDDLDFSYDLLSEGDGEPLPATTAPLSLFGAEGNSTRSTRGHPSAVNPWRKSVFRGFEPNLIEAPPPNFQPIYKFIPTEHLVRFPEKKRLRFNNFYWQMLSTKNWKIYLYSAFYDNRTLVGRTPVIRILGIGNSSNIGTKNNSVYCQLWFTEFQKVKIVRVTEGRSLLPWKKKAVKGANLPHMLTCPLKSKELKNFVPFAVSIVKERRESATNSLRVIHYPFPKKASGEFAVCVKGLDFPETDTSQKLIEWIELLILLGVSKIQIYLYAVHPKTQKVLEYYVKKGIVEVGPLTIPGSLTSRNIPQLRHALFLQNIMIKRQLEILPYNDCLYRNMYHFKYLALLDVDEVIIPLKVKTWKELLEAIVFPNETKKADSYQFRQNGCFFDGVTRPWFKNMPEPMHMLQHVYKLPRDRDQFIIGSKAFFVPSSVLVAFNHWPLACLQKSCRRVYVNETVAQLQHYKNLRYHCGLNKANPAYSCQDLSCLKIHQRDTTIWKYKNDLIPRFQKAVSNIFK